MSHRVYFESDYCGTTELFVPVTDVDLINGGEWVMLYFTESDGIQTVPAHVVNRIVLEDDATVEGIDQHVIHLTDEGAYALVDDYELQGTWIEYIDAEREQRLLVPSERVEAIDMDTSYEH